MSSLISLIGKEFGRLTVVAKAKSRNTRTCWLCSCTCGGLKEVLGANLVTGRTKSCGCLHDEKFKINRHKQTRYLGSQEQT